VTAGLLAAAAVAALALVAGYSSSAFASYTPVPTAVQSAAAAELQDDCLASSTDRGGRVTAAITERRGNFVFTLVATEAAFGNCLVLDPAATSTAGEEIGATTWGATSDLSTPAPDEASASWGATFQTSAGDSYTSATGRMGANVTDVTILPSDQDGVQASTNAGYFTAWWPGRPDSDLTLLLTMRDGSQVRQVLELS